MSDPRDQPSRAAFIRSHTALMAPPLIPEITLHLASESVPLWQKTEEELGAPGLPPPFWAFAWAGGQALTRYLLDRPQTVRGRGVLDLASGSGLVAIAAKLAGAATVLAADIDAYAGAAIALNSALSSVDIAVTTADLLQAPPPPFEVILVGDLFYEKSLAARVTAWLRQAQAQDSTVLIGDPGRSYLPKPFLVELAAYQVPVTRDLEDTDIKRSAVWRLQPMATHR